MSQRRNHVLFSPRVWLAAGASAIGMSLVVGYHEEHRSAQDLLHRKVGLPEQVMIQNFAPDLHVNLIGQVRVLGEIETDRQTRLNIGSVDEPNWINVFPIFPVGRETMPVAQNILNENSEVVRRPMPRDRADQISMELTAIDAMESAAFAFAVTSSESGLGHKLDSAIPPSANVVLTSGDRMLIELSGALVGGASLLQTVSSKMVDNGVVGTPDTLMIEPANAAPEGLLSEHQAANLRYWLAALGVMCSIMSLISAYWDGTNPFKRKTADPIEDVQASSAFPAVNFFQPIATQQELAREEQEAQVRPASRLSRAIEEVRTRQAVVRNS